jgi:hypothetical protein
LLVLSAHPRADMTSASEYAWIILLGCTFKALMWAAGKKLRDYRERNKAKLDKPKLS